MAIENTFSILPDRRFDQDPRFGLIVLSEIASRALSPAVNDPGTAIRVLGAGHRTLADFVDTKRGAKAGIHLRVHAPALTIDDMFDDFFRPIARDGASVVEVQLRLCATLSSLAAHAPDIFGKIARRHADAAKRRADDALSFEGDRAALHMSDF